MVWVALMGRVAALLPDRISVLSLRLSVSLFLSTYLSMKDLSYSQPRCGMMGMIAHSFDVLRLDAAVCLIANQCCVLNCAELLT